KSQPISIQVKYGGDAEELWYFDRSAGGTCRVRRERRTGSPLPFRVAYVPALLEYASWYTTQSDQLGMHPLISGAVGTHLPSMMYRLKNQFGKYWHMLILNMEKIYNDLDQIDVTFSRQIRVMMQGKTMEFENTGSG